MRINSENKAYNMRKKLSRRYVRWFDDGSISGHDMMADEMGVVDSAILLVECEHGVEDKYQ